MPAYSRSKATMLMHSMVASALKGLQLEVAGGGNTQIAGRICSLFSRVTPPKRRSGLFAGHTSPVTSLQHALTDRLWKRRLECGVLWREQERTMAPISSWRLPYGCMQGCRSLVLFMPMRQEGTRSFLENRSARCFAGSNAS